MKKTPQVPKLSLPTRWKAPDNPFVKRFYGTLILLSTLLQGLSVALFTISAVFPIGWSGQALLYFGLGNVAIIALGYILKRLTVDYERLRRQGFFLIPLFILFFS